MRVLFAAGDVGGARALIPVMVACAGRGIPHGVVRHGYLAEHMPAECTPVEPTTDLPSGVVAFASSVADDFALGLACRAQSVGRRTLHLLDSWCSYRTRLERDGVLLRADRYAVMDELARAAAIASGIDPATVVITGQPALADLRHAPPSQRQRPQVAFISEPVAQDQGSDARWPSYRGYTETQVLQAFCQAAQGAEVDVLLQPHPRQDAASLMATWHAHRGTLTGDRSPHPTGRDAVLAADAVVGMASILLYEAWLLGKPVLSLQPGLRSEELNWVAARPGVVSVTHGDQVAGGVANWLAQLGDRRDAERNQAQAHKAQAHKAQAHKAQAHKAQAHPGRVALEQHRQAPGAVLNLIEALMEEP